MIKSKYKNFRIVYRTNLIPSLINIPISFIQNSPRERDFEMTLVVFLEAKCYAAYSRIKYLAWSNME